ncbi:MAG: hypothetical protein HY393_04170 [Candidatus Diapherotrites archaeon]|nr:hypothetical protein [Candidatus Diapherotrites archaeon]
MPPQRSRKKYSGIDNKKLFKRVSQITGVPVQALHPVKIRHKSFGDVNPAYSNTEHSYRFHPLVGWLEPIFKPHEYRHALQNLLSPPRQKLLIRYFRMAYAKAGTKDFYKAYPLFPPILRRAGRHRKFRELTNPLVSKKGAHGMAFNALQASPNKLLLALFFPFTVFFFSEYRIARHTQSIFKKHGEDGAILLWADSPIDPNGRLIKPLREWEKEMVQRGYLFPNSGFTRAGLKHVREKIDSGEIFRQLQIMKRLRTKANK